VIRCGCGSTLEQILPKASPFIVMREFVHAAQIESVRLAGFAVRVIRLGKFMRLKTLRLLHE
jgi:hypothetical protein